MESTAAPHILVMNDVQEMIDLLEELLTEEGYRVSTSTFMLDLHKIVEIAPDAIVLDILFAGEDLGWKFLTLARLDPRIRPIPVILCTAAVPTVRPMVEHLASIGVQVVYKPFDIDQLLTTLNNVLIGPRAIPDA